ncbi:MAG: Riboflavin biosynthesis protein [Pseudonocardiales bacterium]|nr:Riboflavin biosynthesis protein [Pseudonocardiales bacterium]
MQEWLGVEQIPDDWGRCVVTVGVLDGVHVGHAALISRAVDRAREMGLPCVVLTFDRHPAVILDPDRAPAMLTSPAYKSDLIAALGIDAMMVLHFTRDMSEMSPQDFVKTVIVDGLHAAAVVVGENFTFGYRASGNVDQLTELGRGYGFEVEALPLLAGPETAAAMTVSATAIRAALIAGEVERVRELLGHPYRADGVVVRGEQRGRELGYPTANLRMPDNAAVPADGVYAGRVIRLGDDGHPLDVPPLGWTAMSVGTNPTFDGRFRSVEGYILDFDDNLYGDRLGMEFWYRLRGMERFDSIDALIEQMHRDVTRTRELMTS